VVAAVAGFEPGIPVVSVMEWIPAMALSTRVVVLSNSAVVALIAIACGALTGCAWRPFAKPPQPLAQAPTENVPPRLIQRDFSTQETARLCLTTAQRLDDGGHPADAAAQYERARQLDPSLTAVSWRLAILYTRLGNPTRAETEFATARKLWPANPDLLSDYGYFLMEQGRAPQAEAVFREALSITPGHARAASNLGLLLAQQGRLPESFAVFSASVGPAAAHSNIGVVLAQQGKKSEAERAFREALAIAPQLEQPRILLEQLQKPAASQASLPSKTEVR
jgi:Tfp pilus assembly protein PilF